MSVNKTMVLAISFLIVSMVIGSSVFGGVIFQDDFADTDNWNAIHMTNASDFWVDDGNLVINNYNDGEVGTTSTTRSWVATDVKEEFNFFERELTFEFSNYAVDTIAGGESSPGSRRRRGIAIMGGMGDPYRETEGQDEIPGIYLEFRYTSNGTYFGFANQGETGRVHTTNALIEADNLGFTWSSDLISLTLNQDGYRIYDEGELSAEGLWADSGVELSPEGWENGASIVMGEWHFQAPGQYQSRMMFDGVTVIPEPGSLVLLSIAGLALLHRRRR